MKQRKKRASGKGNKGKIFFLGGFGAALIFGWVLFPQFLFSQKPQPLNFSHAAHQDSACEDCHYLRKDGTFSGVPNVNTCRECHETAMGDSHSEKVLVEQYIQKNREIPWRVYAWQPDNVYFSHAPHQIKGVKCDYCHRDVTNEQKLPVYKVNRLTGYTPTTMKMDVCEQCHAENKATNDCQMCHK